MARKTKRAQHRPRAIETRRRKRHKPSIKGGGLLDYIWPSETKGPPKGTPPPGTLSTAALGRATGDKGQSFVMPPPPTSEQIAERPNKITRIATFSSHGAPIGTPRSGGHWWAKPIGGDHSLSPPAWGTAHLLTRTLYERYNLLAAAISSSKYGHRGVCARLAPIAPPPARREQVRGCSDGRPAERRGAQG